MHFQCRHQTEYGSVPWEVDTNDWHYRGTQTTSLPFYGGLVVRILESTERALSALSHNTSVLSPGRHASCERCPITSVITVASEGENDTACRTGGSLHPIPLMAPTSLGAFASCCVQAPVPRPLASSSLSDLTWKVHTLHSRHYQPSLAFALVSHMHFADLLHASLRLPGLAPNELERSVIRDSADRKLPRT